MKHVEIFTDGACKGNPGPGGWGALLKCGAVERELEDLLELRLGLVEHALLRERRELLPGH